MTHTQAQIDAARNVIARLRMVEGIGAEEIAKAALSAAAEVGNWPSDELVNDLVASATEEDRLTKHNPPAAEVELSTASSSVSGLDAIRDAIRLARQSERERCARVADKYAERVFDDPVSRTIAAEIRALKDEPFNASDPNSGPVLTGRPPHEYW